MTSDAQSIDPPMPMPNVAGAYAGAHGLPDRAKLSVGQRLIVGASAVSDLGLRTAVASLIGAAMIPTVLVNRGQLRHERENLRFYADLATEHDVAKSFPAPTLIPRIAARRANPLTEQIAHGTVENVTFTSSFEAINPAMRKTWRSLTTNAVVRLQHWRHDDGPRPTLALIHGFMGSAYLFNGLFFSLPWFYRCGYDVVLYTLPFHGRRAERCSPFSGYGYFARGASGFAESMAQAVHDFRSVVDYLEYTGVERVALTGMSLGGYTAALIAAVEPRLQAVIPNVPVVSIVSEVEEWFPANKLFTIGRWLGGIPRAEFAAAAAYHSPLSYAPVLPADRRLIITGLGDRLAPPEQSELLWEHWDRCALHWFPGNHLLHVSQPEYLRRMTRFLHTVMWPKICPEPPAGADVTPA